MRTNRGIIDGGLLLLLAGLCLGVAGGSWKPFLGFKKGPQTKQLAEAQAALVTAQQKAKEAEAQAQAAILAERAKMEGQVRSAQGDAFAASTALNKVKEPSPELRVAKAFAGRVNMKLAVAIGALPADQQEAMISLVDGLIADTEDAKAKLAALDGDFRALSKERDAIKAQIPQLEAEARKAAQNAQEAQAEVTTKTNLVAKWADTARAKELENGSLGTAFNRILYLLAFLAAGWVFLAFIVPLILKHMRPSLFKTVVRHVSGFAVGGLHYVDASKKISALKPTPTP